ncbi:MAG TPA: hypothetical protein PKB10_12585, partial [Tepidisphaeraceae bacterium]|nr:hypothetical protein [Tepidisphaeraceae bacterium]
PPTLAGKRWQTPETRLADSGQFWPIPGFTLLNLTFKPMIIHDLLPFHRPASPRRGKLPILTPQTPSPDSTHFLKYTKQTHSTAALFG